MINRSKLDRVHAHDGVVAAFSIDAQQRASNDVSWSGDEQWKAVALEAARLRELADQEQVRVLAGDHALLLFGDKEDVVGIVFIKGHPVVKSVVRMVRQLLRHAQNGRSQAAAPTPAANTPSPTPSTPHSGGSLTF